MGLLALAGLRLSRAQSREPAPLLTAMWKKTRPAQIGLPAGLAFETGVVMGLALIGAIALINCVVPQTLPGVLHPSSLWGAIFASATASFGEEILFRLFLLSALLRILPASTKNTVIAVVVSSLLFGAFHAPAAVFLFGGISSVPPFFWVWMISLNGFVGVACALWYLRIGIGAAILVHFGTDLVWQGVSKLF